MSSTTQSMTLILDAIRDFETRMGGGSQRLGSQLLSETPRHMRPTAIRMKHLVSFYLSIRYAAKIYAVEMASEPPKSEEEKRVDATLKALEVLAESFGRISPTAWPNDDARLACDTVDGRGGH